MANRRMVSKSISYSKQVNQLSEFGKLLFTWTIPHLDDFGRIDGDPEVLKAMVMPLSSLPVAEFEKTINEMVAAGLITRYQVQNQSVIEYPGFERHQTGLNKRTKSKYPDNSKKFSEFPRNSSLMELNRTELNRTEQINDFSSKAKEKTESLLLKGKSLPPEIRARLWDHAKELKNG